MHGPSRSPSTFSPAPPAPSQALTLLGILSGSTCARATLNPGEGRDDTKSPVAQRRGGQTRQWGTALLSQLPYFHESFAPQTSAPCKKITMRFCRTTTDRMFKEITSIDADSPRSMARAVDQSMGIYTQQPPFRSAQGALRRMPADASFSQIQDRLRQVYALQFERQMERLQRRVCHPIASAPVLSPEEILQASLSKHHEVPVAITSANGVVRVRRAIYANMDEGLAIVRSGMRETGAASDGFASCFAVVLRTTDAVGVAHTSSIPSLLREEIREFRDEFRQVTGTGGELSLGYSTAGYLEDMEEEVARCGLAPFIDGQNFKPCAVRGMPTTQEEAFKRVIERHIAGITRVAQATQAHLFNMPHCGVYVPIRGPIQVFAREQYAPDFRPLIKPTSETAPR